MLPPKYFVTQARHRIVVRAILYDARFQIGVEVEQRRSLNPPSPPGSLPLRANWYGMNDETSRGRANEVKRVASDECESRLVA